jgi:hypothetical protein
MHNLDENVVITKKESENKPMEFIVDCNEEIMNNINELPKKPDLKEVLQNLSELESEKQEIMNNLQKPDLSEKAKSQEEILLKAVNMMIQNINDYLRKEEEEEEKEKEKEKLSLDKEKEENEKKEESK